MILYFIFVNFVLRGEKKQNELSLILSGFKHGHGSVLPFSFFLFLFFEIEIGLQERSYGICNYPPLFLVYFCSFHVFNLFRGNQDRHATPCCVELFFNVNIDIEFSVLKQNCYDLCYCYFFY